MAEKPVYRLKITKLANKDSLPEELFRLTELRELTVKEAKLRTMPAVYEKITTPNPEKVVSIQLEAPQLSVQ